MSAPTVLDSLCVIHQFLQSLTQIWSLMWQLDGFNHFGSYDSYWVLDNVIFVAIYYSVKIILATTW